MDKTDAVQLDRQAPRSRVNDERELIDKIDAGLADAAAGRLTDHETVAAAMRRIYHPKP